MADEIIQQLGFDASAALDALAQMDSALGNFRVSSWARWPRRWGLGTPRAARPCRFSRTSPRGPSSAAAAMAKLAAAFAGQQANFFAGRPLGPNDLIAGAGFPSAQEQAQAQMQAISQGPTITPKIDKTPIEDADRAAAKFVVSWETLSRVVMTQAIVRALSAIRDAMHEAFESNLEFMTRMAEIQSTLARRLDQLGFDRRARGRVCHGSSTSRSPRLRRPNTRPSPISSPPPRSRLNC